MFKHTQIHFWLCNSQLSRVWVWGRKHATPTRFFVILIKFGDDIFTSLKMASPLSLIGYFSPILWIKLKELQQKRLAIDSITKFLGQALLIKIIKRQKVVERGITSSSLKVILDVKLRGLQKHFLRSAQTRLWISADMEMKLCINWALPTYQAYL